MPLMISNVIGINLPAGEGGGGGGGRYGGADAGGADGGGADAGGAGAGLDLVAAGGVPAHPVKHILRHIKNKIISAMCFNFIKNSFKIKYSPTISLKRYYWPILCSVQVFL